MKQLLLVALGVASFGPAAGQHRSVPTIAATSSTVRSFIPKGYDTLDGGTAHGDLDGDGKTDVAVILRSDEEKSETDMDSTPDRILLVLLNNGAGYKLIGKSAGIIMCKDCGGVYGDPFSSIVIHNRVLSVSHYGGSAWRWLDEEKFRYQNGGLYLIGTTSDSYFVNSDCNGKGVGDAGRKYKDINWVTGDEEIIENDDDCKPVKHLNHKRKKGPLVKLEAYKQD